MKSVAMFAAALLAGSSTAALAQSGYGGYQGGQGYYQGAPGYQGQPYQSPGFGRSPAGPSFAQGPAGGAQGMDQREYRRRWVPGPVSPAAPDQGNVANPYSRLWPPGTMLPSAGSRQTQMGGQLGGQNRFEGRVQLRRQLRQAGFHNIRILDSMYLVRAQTPTGRPIAMVIRPADQDTATASVSARQDQSFGQGRAARGQQFGTGQDFGTGSGQDLPPIMTPGLMSESQVRSRLQSRGFSNISDLRQDGTTFTGRANWYGEHVDLRIDGRNAFVIEPSHMTPNQVRRMLDEKGWGEVDTVELRDTSYRVQASRNGTPFTLWIDARTGEIDRRIASSG